MNILDIPAKTGLQHFQMLLQHEGVRNAAAITDIANKTIKYLNGNDSLRAELSAGQLLEQRWYESLERNNPDYDVYATDYYLAELWACWTVYSRKYLQNISKPSSLPPQGLMQHLGEVRCVVDLGCGFGFTTAALSQMFPNAQIYGTNIPNTLQTKIAHKITQSYGGTIIGDVEEINHPVDLIFASEYFEHFQEPIKHLEHILRYTPTRAWLIANAFTAKAIGHFNKYHHNDAILTGKETNTLFSKTLQNNGYRKIQTKLWNNRPNYWIREHHGTANQTHP